MLQIHKSITNFQHFDHQKQVVRQIHNAPTSNRSSWIRAKAHFTIQVSAIANEPCNKANVLQTKVDAHCDELATVEQS